MASSEGPSRVTIVAPKTRMDLALPSEIPLAELLPTLLHHAGEELADDGAEHGGWTLRRLGGPPLDTGRSAAQLEIRDGEMLYFVPRHDTTPEVVFDDVGDAVATATQSRPGRWAAADTRQFAVGLTVAALFGGLATVLFAGPPQLPGSLVAAGVSVVLLVTAALTSRVGGDSRTGALFALIAIAYAGGCGLLMLAGDRAVAELAAPDLLMAATLLVVAGALATLAVGDYPQVLLGASVIGIALGVAATICLVFDVSPAGAAAIVGTVTFGTMPAHPMLSYRLAGLPIPAVPTGPEDLRADASTVDGRRVLALSERAAEFLVGLIVAASMIVAAAVVVLVLDGSLGGRVLAALLAVLILLRARPLLGRPQRTPPLVAGAVGLGAVTATVFLDAGLGGRLGMVGGGLAAFAVVSAVYGLGVAGRRISPTWGRLLDILEILLIVALVPVAAWVVGAFDWVATIGR